MDPLALQRYDNAVAQTGAPLQNCFGFMDCTARPIAQGLTPINELLVTGIRAHTIKFQSISFLFSLFCLRAFLYDHPTSFSVTSDTIAIENGKTPTRLFRVLTSKRLEQIKSVKNKHCCEF